MQLYRGDLLPGCYEEWILPERDRLRQLFLSAAQSLIELLEQERAYGDAIAVALQLLRQDSLHEATYRQLMRLYALRGDRAAALRAYHTCAQLMERELGTEPGAMTRAVYTSLMQSESAPEPPGVPQATHRVEAPLQGRKAEWRLLQKVWNMATGGIVGSQAGCPQLVLLTGEAGIGKTRLARELELWVSRLGMATASARCYTALGHLAYAPVTSWLRCDALQTNLSALDPTALTEIARLVPEVLAAQPRLAPPGAMTEDWQRQFFFAALARAVLSARQPLLLLLDDLQWCDQETLQWLHYLLHAASAARLLLVGTVRVEETSPEHPLLAFLSALQRENLVTEVSLGPLTLEETGALAASLLLQHPRTDRSNGETLTLPLAPIDQGGLSRKIPDRPGDFAADNVFTTFTGESLYRETEGNPLFVVEMVRASIQNKDSGVPASQRSLLTRSASQLPTTVQAVFVTRLAQLSARARTVANIAAVIGREFAFSVLARVSGESAEDLVQGLDELWQRRMVREHGGEMANAYDFSHDKLREQIYATLSPAHRRLLHQRVAEAFKDVYSADQAAVCGQIAAHYERAGLAAQAIPFYQQAGQVAGRIYAHAEALHAFEQAATLLGQMPAGLPWQTIVQVFISLGDTHADLSSHEDARQAYQRAMLSVPPEEPIWQARLHWKIATTWTYTFAQKDDPLRARSFQAFEEAERILTRVAEPAHPAWRDEWLALQFARAWRGSADEIEAALDKARPVVEQHGTQEQRKLLAEAVGVRNAIRDRFVIPPQRVAAWRAAIAALEPTENETQRGMDLALLGIGLLSAAQFEEAEQQLRHALRLGERTGNAWVQQNCLTFLPFTLRSRGQVEEVRRILAQAESRGIALNNRILAGHRAWLAWRDGDLVLAESCGRASIQELQSRQVRPNPFLWAGRWPLIGVALAREQIAAAIDDVRLLFDSTQQPPREPLAELLTAVLQAWDTGEQEQARALLQQTLPLATEMGYL